MDPKRPPTHRVYFSDLLGVTPVSVLRVEGEEANHAARVKRVRPGEPVEVFDGRGLVARAVVLRAEAGKRALLELEVGDHRTVAPVRPRVEVWCPPPKGDRLETMIDQLSQVGAAAWRPLATERSERDSFRADRLARASVESAKQCGRAWLLEIGGPVGLEAAFEDPRVVVCDAAGGPFGPGDAGTDTVLLTGPEGGWTARELERARAAGRPLVRFGAHAMRIETAAVASAACLLARATTGGDG